MFLLKEEMKCTPGPQHNYKLINPVLINGIAITFDKDTQNVLTNCTDL